jgi:hypothetical protein
MNIGGVIGLCVLSFLIGYAFGTWKEGASVSKAIDDLSACIIKKFNLLLTRF